jgi:hypothetical protein
MIGPAIVFWVGATLAWAFAGPGLSRLTEISEWLNRQTAVAQLVTMLVTLAVIAASAIVVQRLTSILLRLMQGYWPLWLDPLGGSLLSREEKRKNRDERTWQEMTLHRHSGDAELTSRERAELSMLERRRRHRPVLHSELMPTRLGNILRAAETRPGHRYGFEAVIVWPRLWLVLPDAVRQELAAARKALDVSVAVVLWGTAFVAFTPWVWWAAPLGIAVAATASWWWVPSRAELFADLVEATYDLYRSALYMQLRWPLPSTPAEELASGNALTEYLLRGSDAQQPRFTSPREESDQHEKGR